jgi:hypothetical protein
MPRFEVVSLADAEINSSTGKRAEIMKEYLGYIGQLPKGKAGRLQVSQAETAGAVRRRLGAAARMAGKSLVIRRTNDEIYFWVRSAAGKSSRGPGRPPKADTGGNYN